MQYLKEYLIQYKIEEDLKFLLEDDINEGKFKDGVKKAWGWLKGKFKKSKKEKKEHKPLKTIDKSYNNDNNIENDNEVKYGIYTYDKIKEKIYKNNNLDKGKNIVEKGYNNKIRIAVAEDKDNVYGCLFFITHDKYERPSEFLEYKDYDHILSMQIDKNHFNSGISEGLINIVVKEIKSLSSYKGLTLNIKEYNTKPKLYEKYFIIKKNKDAKIAIYKE